MNAQKKVDPLVGGLAGYFLFNKSEMNNIMYICTKCGKEFSPDPNIKPYRGMLFLFCQEYEKLKKYNRDDNKKITLLIELAYNAKTIYEDSQDGFDWFKKEILYGNGLLMHSNEMGCTLGNVKVLSVIEK
jgi:hypothetical protein